MDGDDFARLLYMTGFLVLVSGSLVAYRNRMPEAFRHAGVWVGLFAVLIVLYAYKANIERFAAPVISVLNPSRAVEMVSGDGGRSLMISRSGDGHFHLNSRVNDVPVSFLVDTGATNLVLTFDDAVRAGIDTDRLRFSQPVRTANGIAYQAGTELDSLQLGSFTLENVRAGVMQDGLLSTSLLGMDVLNRFMSVRIEGDRLIISPHA